MRKATLAAALTAAEGQVDALKLAKLREVLASALPIPLEEVRSDDPVMLRRSMVKVLRVRGATPGHIQSMEQFFMGVMRRAALVGLAAPPPEGPWTRAWQHLLVLVSEAPRGRSACRALAGWATQRDLEPRDLTSSKLDAAVSARVISEREADTLRPFLELVAADAPARLPSDEFLAERLRLKASVGTTRIHSVGEARQA